MSPAMMDALYAEGMDLQKQGDKATSCWKLEGHTHVSMVSEESPGVEIRRVLLRGSEKAFCSGADLSEVDPESSYESTRALGVRMHQIMSAALKSLDALPVPTFSEVSGPAVGGGTELSLATDFRLWGRRGSFRMVQSQMGVSPGWDGGRKLVARVGSQAAKRILLSGMTVNPRQAVTLGLADALEASPDLSPADEQHALDHLIPVISGGADARTGSVCADCECHGKCHVSPWVHAAMDSLAPLTAAPGAVGACKAALDPQGYGVEFIDVWGGTGHREALRRRRRLRRASE
jgi:enoyl-CoA hydratase/carnithine racemase